MQRDDPPKDLMPSHIQSKIETGLSHSSVTISRGHQPGIIQSAIQMQVKYYTQTPGFNEDYNTLLTQGLSKLEMRIGQDRTEVWAANLQDKIIGAIFVDGENIGQNRARLTSFIVDEGYRGLGIGRRLLTAAMRFVDEQQFEETHLWTFAGSDAARRLYESVGFSLEKQSEGEYFGKQLTVQLFVRPRQGMR